MYGRRPNQAPKQLRAIQREKNAGTSESPVYLIYRETKPSGLETLGVGGSSGESRKLAMG